MWVPIADSDLKYQELAAGLPPSRLAVTFLSSAYSCTSPSVLSGTWNPTTASTPPRNPVAHRWLFPTGIQWMGCGSLFTTSANPTCNHVSEKGLVAATRSCPMMGHTHPMPKEIAHFCKCQLACLLSGHSVLGTILGPGETGFLLHLESGNKWLNSTFGNRRKRDNLHI